MMPERPVLLLLPSLLCDAALWQNQIKALESIVDCKVPDTTQHDNIAALAATQLLHGLTFALLHLACMQVIRAVVPEGLSATAQTLYGYPQHDRQYISAWQSP